MIVFYTITVDVTTRGFLVRSQALCPLSYRGIVPSAGVEPAVSSISARRLYHLGRDGLAERVGFEPTDVERPCLSGAVPSATRPPLLGVL